MKPREQIKNVKDVFLFYYFDKNVIQNGQIHLCEKKCLNDLKILLAWFSAEIPTTGGTCTPGSRQRGPRGCKES